jgi:hypothetical protein
VREGWVEVPPPIGRLLPSHVKAFIGHICFDFRKRIFPLVASAAV